jgi:hypothetical protein
MSTTNGTNGTNTTSVTAFDALVNSAIDIRDALNGNVQQLNLAVENEASKRRTAKELRTSYEEAEAEFVAETLPNCDAKNAEGRKAQLDAALVAARRDGTLANLWAQANAAAYDAEDAKVGLEQCSKTYRATEAAAELTAAMLRAAAR